VQLRGSNAALRRTCIDVMGDDQGGRTFRHVSLFRLCRFVRTW
jgi:hypothetical protein